VSAARTSHERRKVVTVIFADVVGSTALGERVGPETLRWAMQRWFERMVGAIESQRIDDRDSCPPHLGRCRACAVRP
jgi:class 3 adenylate cyclase